MFRLNQNDLAIGMQKKVNVRKFIIVFQLTTEIWMLIESYNYNYINFSRQIFRRDCWRVAFVSISHQGSRNEILSWESQNILHFYADTFVFLRKDPMLYASCLSTTPIWIVCQPL